MRTATTTEARVYKGFGAGVGAALVMIIVMALVRFSLGVPSIPELLQGVLLRLVPGNVFEFMIHLLKAGAKVLLLVSVLEGILLVGGGLGWLFARQWRGPAPGAGYRSRVLGDRYLAGTFYGLAVGAALVVVFLLLFWSGWMNPQPDASILVPVSLSLLAYGLAFGLALVALLPWPGSATAVVPEASDRRGFMRIAGGTVLALVAGAGVWGVLAKVLAEPDAATLIAAASGGAAAPVTGADATVTADIATAIAQSGGGAGSRPSPVPATATAAPANPAAPGATDTTGPAATNTAAPGATNTAGPGATNTAPAAPNTAAPTSVAQAPPTAVPTAFPAVPVLVPEITPTDNFYITTKNFSDPSVDAAAWTLTIKGLVANPITLTLAQVKAFPQVKVFHTLECISNTVGGDLIGNGFWTGIRMADVMQKAGPRAGVADVIFRAADDYSDSIPLAALVHPDTVLAYEMNGKPLSTKHGFPARLLIPGIFGMKNVKWLTSIELVNYDYKGFWQSQGWSDPAPYLTMSRIDYPKEGAVPQKPLYVGGVAFAGNRGISRVEVSVDGGRTWADAQLRRALSRNAWVLWTYPWIPKGAGDTALVVRATDGTGQVQDATNRDNFPDGATGYHKVAVKVVGA